MQTLVYDLRKEKPGSESTDIITNPIFDFDQASVDSTQTTDDLGKAILARIKQLTGSVRIRCATPAEPPLLIPPFFPREMKGSSTAWEFTTDWKPHKVVELHVAAQSAIRALLAAEEKRRIAANKEAEFFSYLTDEAED